MKLEEAACILGVSVDTSVENLKSTYRKLALHWHPDKVNIVIIKSKTIINLISTHFRCLVYQT